MQLHPDGHSLQSFPQLKPYKCYRVWDWYCDDPYCCCGYVYIMEADRFESEQKEYGLVTTAVNGRRVWQGSWVTVDDEEGAAVLKAERKAAEDYVKKGVYDLDHESID